MSRRCVMGWSDEELASLRLGDERLDARAARSLELFASFPSLSIPTSCSSKGEEDAIYRFFAKSHASHRKILAAHRDTTVGRATEHQRVLATQDTTELDFTRPTERVGGALNSKKRRGFHARVTLASTQDGVPLGVVSAKIWARSTMDRPDAKKYWKKPLHKKESGRWLEGYHAIAEFGDRRLAGTQVIALSDSEGDIYECLAAGANRASLPNFIVRACHDRSLPNEGLLYETLRAAPVLSRKLVHVRAKRAASFDGRRRKAAKAERDAEVHIRAKRVRVNAPKDRTVTVPFVDMNAVFVSEADPPPGEPGLEWMLLKDLAIDTLAAVEDIIDLYTKRWGIEVYFSTLKRGC